MFKWIISYFLLISHFTQLFSLEKSTTFDGLSKGSLFIESSQDDTKLIIHSYTLENISNQAIHGLFPVINMNREDQKKQMHQELTDKNDLWKWWEIYHPISETEGAFSSLIGSSLQIPCRNVPSRCRSLREFYFDGRWQLIDNVNQLIYLSLDNHTLAGYEEIADEPFLVLRTKSTALEDIYRFDHACANFAQLDLFPHEFDCSEPDDTLLLNWKDHLCDLYPHEKIQFFSDGTVKQTILLEERINSPGVVRINSGFPITQLANHSSAAVTLEDQNFLVETNQVYDFNDQIFTGLFTFAGRVSIVREESDVAVFDEGIAPAISEEKNAADDSLVGDRKLSEKVNKAIFSIDLNIIDPKGNIEIISKGNKMPLWNEGSNRIDLGVKKIPSTRLTLQYDRSKCFPKNSPLSVANTSDHFDHCIPYFELKQQDQIPEKIWWQISFDQNFHFLIPNLQRIQEFSNLVQIDPLSDTFFNPQETYYFRIKGCHNNQWSDWSPSFAFTVSKPNQIKDPVFKKLGTNEYQISWEPAADSDTRYLIFASNSFDFMPSIYVNQQYNVIDENTVDVQEIENLQTITSDCSIKIGTEYAFYRIIAERQGQYSIPSPLIRVYDYGLSIPRNVLQTRQSTPQSYKVERIPFPKPYPHFVKQDGFEKNEKKSCALDIMQLLSKEYYVKHKFISDEAWIHVKPFLLPENHPIKSKLDRLFSQRVTQDNETLKKAGFEKPDPRRFSNTIVSKNKHIPGYIFKFYSDEQKGMADWLCLLGRVTGALYIQDALNRYHINHLFVVPSKWLYPLPEEPSPSGHLERKNFILVANCLDVFSGKENNKMWRSPIITPFMLSCIYQLLSELGLNDSPYNFNMPFTKDGRIAFIDTEHHHKWPIPFYKLWSFLSPAMRKYWDEICEKG